MDYGFLPSSKGQWIYQVALISLLLWAGYSYFSASAEARLLGDQLEVSMEETEALTNSLEDERERSDALIAQQDDIEEGVAEDLEEAEEEVEEASGETDQAIAAALELAEDYPVIRDALIAAQNELAEEREEREEEKAVAASALFASQQRNRTLSNQLLSERSASDLVIEGLRTDLSLSMDESDAWQRAASPGALKQLWQQGRAALLAIVVFVAVK